jgi:hypothetical protein
MDITINGVHFTLDNFVAGQYMLIDDMLTVTGTVSLERIENPIIVCKILNNEFGFPLSVNGVLFGYYLDYLDYLLATPLVMKLFYEKVINRLDAGSIKLEISNKIHRMNILRLMYPASVSIHVTIDLLNRVFAKSQEFGYYHLKVDGTQRSNPTDNLQKLSEQLADYLSIVTSIPSYSKIVITYTGPVELLTNRMPNQLHCPLLMKSNQSVTITDGKFDLTPYIVSYLDKTFSE